MVSSSVCDIIIVLFYLVWDLTGVSWSWCWVLSTTGHSRHATRHLLAPPLSPAPHTRARSVRLARPTRSYAINQSIYNCFKYGQNRRHSRTSTSPLQTRPGRRLWCGEVLKGMLFYLGETQVIYTPAPATISIILECFASPKKYEVIMCAELSRKIGKGSQARTESTDYIIIIILYLTYLTNCYTNKYLRGIVCKFHCEISNDFIS